LLIEEEQVEEEVVAHKRLAVLYDLLNYKAKADLVVD
jgi:hypothetical protein